MTVPYESIQNAVILGNAGSIPEAVNKLLEQGYPAQQILDDHLLPGMTIVGERFKRNEMFLPQVLMSAQAMQTAIDLLRPFLLCEGGVQERQTIIIGTVKGDMHDIGKNLVRIMLIGAGYEVVDLGVNVPAQHFLNAADEYQATIVCLSALLSSTMNNMREIIQGFRESADFSNTKIIIGGAPVSRKFSISIGADGYAPTAPAAVEQIQHWLHSPNNNP